jgi:hypothetical protein
MLKRDRIINKLRELNYKFGKETPNTYAYRSGTHWVFVPKTDLVSETWAAITLSTCGCKQPEIEEFIRIAKL